MLDLGGYSWSQLEEAAPHAVSPFGKPLSALIPEINVGLGILVPKASQKWIPPPLSGAAHAMGEPWEMRTLKEGAIFKNFGIFFLF